MFKKYQFITLVFILFVNHAAASPPEIREKVKRLIEELHSPNKPLNLEANRRLVSPPSNYDLKAQQKIESAIKELGNLGKAAFPLLIANKDNKNYCRSYSTSVLRNFSVGETCLEILSSHFAFSKVRYGYKGMPDYGWSIIETDPSGWWKNNKEKSLLEMKIQALEWTIKKEIENYKTWGELFEMSKDNWNKQLVAPLQNHLKKLLESKNNSFHK